MWGYESRPRLSVEPLGSPYLVVGFHMPDNNSYIVLWYLNTEYLVVVFVYDRDFTILSLSKM